jgi:hypothetical protein
VNRAELIWLLQTIKDAGTAERFVLAQYRYGRISFQIMSDVAVDWGWINSAADQCTTLATCHSNEYTTTELTVAFA